MEAVARLLLLVPHLPSPWIHEAVRSGALAWAQRPASSPAPPQHLLYFAATYLAAVRGLDRGMPAAQLSARGVCNDPAAYIVYAATYTGTALCAMAQQDWRLAGFISPATWLFTAERFTTMALAVTTLLHHTVLPRSMALLHMAGEGLEGLYGWLLRSDLSGFDKEGFQPRALLRQQLLELAEVLVQLLRLPKELQHWCGDYNPKLQGPQGGRLVSGILLLLGIMALNDDICYAGNVFKRCFMQGCEAVVSSTRQRPQRQSAAGAAVSLDAALPAEWLKLVTKVAVEAQRTGRLPYDWPEQLAQVQRRQGDPLVRLKRRWVCFSPAQWLCCFSS